MRRLPIRLALAVLVLGYAVVIAWYHAPYAGSTDAAGYMNSARLLLEGKLTEPLRVPADFSPEVPRVRLAPLGFSLDPSREKLLPVYPIGLPLHFAALGSVFGLATATTAVAVISALAFVGLLYGASREFGILPAGSAAVAVLGALSPLTLISALAPMSDLVAATWTLAAIYGALRSNRQTGWAAWAGAAFAVAVFVRPTNLLLILPLGLALPTRLRPWLAFGLGGLPGALFLGAYNHQLYGSLFASGYGDVRSLFSASYLPGTIGHYLRWIPVVATPLVFAGLGLLRKGPERKSRAVLLAWSGVLLVFYGTYYHTSETWWYLRFVLPALPALGIAAALVLQHWRSPAWLLTCRAVPAGVSDPNPPASGYTFRFSAVMLLVLAGVGWNLWWARELRTTQVEIDERSYPLAGRWIAEHLPADGVLVAYQMSGAAYYYSDRPLVMPIDLTPDEAVRLNVWADTHHRVLYAALYPDEEALIREKIPGRWEPVTHLRRVTIWRRH